MRTISMVVADDAWGETYPTDEDKAAFEAAAETVAAKWYPDEETVIDIEYVPTSLRNEACIVGDNEDEDEDEETCDEFAHAAWAAFCNR